MSIKYHEMSKYTVYDKLWRDFVIGRFDNLEDVYKTFSKEIDSEEFEQRYQIFKEYKGEV